MARKIRPYQRKKGSPKQKREHDLFNQFTDELIAVYYQSFNEENKKHKK